MFTFKLKSSKVSWVFPFLVFPLIFIGIHGESIAQGDSTYYFSYRKQLTTRAYISRKYTSLLIVDKFGDSRTRFEPNSTLNLGIGASYNDFTLNLAYGFGFMNPGEVRGETRYLDLQAHIYPKNWVIDLFGQFYNGFYLESVNGEKLDLEEIVLFPDLKLRKLGANVQYLFNGDKISLRAAFLQSAWQKKSAGSLVAGFEAYGGWTINDGILLPPINQRGGGRDFQNLGFFQFGPNLGYVHTFVFWKHFFITGMASANLAIGNSYLDYENNRINRWGVVSNSFLRGFVGYNGPIWSVNANYVHNNVRRPTINDFSGNMATGNYRINFIYRFEVGPKLRPAMKYVDLDRYLPKMLKQKKEN
jgi:hypothetical protein